MAGKKPEDAFDFVLTGNRDVPFLGYDSAQDPTNLSPQYLVQGSKNVYLNNRGNVSVRPGLKLIGDIDTTPNGVVASYEFENAKGGSLPIWVLEDGTMQFNYLNVWYDLAHFEKTRFIFSPWWDNDQKKDQLIMVNGDHNLYAWDGAFAFSASSTATKSVGSISLPGSTGTGYANFDIVEIAGGNGAYIRIDAAPGGIPTLATLLNGGYGYSTAGPTGTTAITGTGTGLIVNIDSLIDTYYLTIQGDETWAGNGFYDPTGHTADSDLQTIIVDGNEYVYGGIKDSVMYGFSSPPVIGMTIQKIVTTENIPDADFTNDFIVTLNNQLIVGSYLSKVIHISFDEDYTLYTQGNDLITGDPDFAVIDEFPTGMVVKEQSIVVFAGNSSFYTLTPNTPVPIEIPISGGNSALVITQVDKQVGAGKSAAISQEFISTVGTDIIYVSQDHQLRTYGTLRNIVTQKTPSLSKAVRQELIDTDLEGGSLRFVDEFAYINAPLEGRTFLYQIRDNVDDVGNLTAQRLWHPFQEWNISRIAVVDGVVEGYSSAYPQAYQLWDTGQWHDDSPDGTPSPYECIARWAYQNNGLKTGLVSFNMAYYEGYIAPNSELNGRIRFDYLGGTKNDDQDGVQDVVISSLEEPGGNGDGNQAGMTLFAGESVAELGVSQTGTQQIGGTTNPLQGFPKFRVIQDVEPTDVFEYQIECFSYSADSRWEIKCVGTNPSQSTNNPTYLRKA